MKLAKVQLTREHLKILNAGKPIRVNLPDAVMEITIHPDAKLRLSIDIVMDEGQRVIDKAKGCRGHR